MSSNGVSEKKVDQYHHYIPRFILRRYQVGPVKSKAERRRLFKKTGIDPEYVHYWDVAKGTLDNLYRDCNNTENVNAVEQKLSMLESRAAAVIKDLHSALPTNRFSVKRRPLEDLRKFLLIMHLRNVGIKDSYFDEDQNGPVREWIKHYKQSQGFKTSAEAWLGNLQYYLDNSHSQIMTHAAEILDKYGYRHIMEWLCGRTSGTEIENGPAITYQSNCGSKYTCVWEAAEGEEFALTHNGFGLWEGIVNGFPCVHNIFVVSPRIVIVLRLNELEPDDVVSSVLVHIKQPPPDVEYHGCSIFPGLGTHKELEAYRSSKRAEEDVFHFNVKRLTVAETMHVNHILLDNVRNDGSVTFASKACMLRTARAYLNPFYLQRNRKIPGLIKLLEDTLTSYETSEGDIDPRKLVHLELFTLLMDISTGKKLYVSAYDRAWAVTNLLGASRDFSSIFALELDERCRSIYMKFLCDCHQVLFIPLAELVETLPDDTSESLFTVLYEAMETCGFVRSTTGSKVDTLQDEALALAFLELACDDVSAWYKLITSDPRAAPILSQLFEEGTTPDDGMIELVMHVVTNPAKFKSDYERALVLHRAVCVSGPLRDDLPVYCSSSIAAIVHGVAKLVPVSSQSAEPKVRLAMRLSQTHWLKLLGMVKGLMAQGGLSFTSGQGKVPSTDLRQATDDVIVIGVLTWMAKHRRDFLNNFCRPRNIHLVETGKRSDAKK
ncbi:hypothetical protein BKA82DRAFT_13281 [Pisolithus tinctorius]|uniref:DUF4238 domain-containing protein n=1 Tax=Pisolithus tinctorius Marx 270 TaxID=870435 RepID=A0A0C3JRK4_PISTI|nr:hypothetical protein BKA82DRAFT_13281 [Pisolithus tinctorius]KIO11788.1 hypothetical protein M404DRAFT_13281 [Pisolithus tinctorius Marx 270]